LPAFPVAHMLVFWDGVRQGFDGFRFVRADAFRKVRCPVLLLQGGRDSHVKSAELQNLARNLNPDSTCKVFPGAPHQSYVASQAAEWRSSVRDFLPKLQGTERQ
jgi:uncharacterized protein